MQNNDNNGKIDENSNLVWEQISDEIVVACSKIFDNVNHVLEAHLKFGFTEIAKNINPSIEDILNILRVIGSSLDSILPSVSDFSEQRLLMNAKQMIWCVENVTLAIKANCIEDYESSIEMMRKQAQQ